MKVSVFFDQYCPFHEEKDPGQIPLGLLETGTKTAVLTIDKKELIGYQPKFPLIKKTVNAYYTEKFWSQEDSDVVICYTWLMKNYSPIIKEIKSAGKKVLIKCDNDGRIGYPFKSHFIRVPLLERLTLSNVMINLWWALPFKFLHAKRATQIIEQIEVSDLVLIESPDAASNISFFLTVWKRKDLIKKIYFLPNPVTPDFVNGKIGRKENIVVSVGRWDDPNDVKNTRVLIKAVVDFLNEKPEYKSVILGSGGEKIKSLINNNCPKNVLDRINILGPVEHKRISDFLMNAKIFFLPSRWEGFPITAAEAVCMGCSIVGTPLESLNYLSMQGFSGTVARTFSEDAILTALLQDSLKWENGNYDPGKISAFWRVNLNRQNVAKSIVHLANKLSQA
jgi:glycosyltransferase involved in cell wall biosynthesis